MRSITVLISLALATTAHAADWPMYFGGPHRTNHSPETGLLQEWPEGGPPLRWDVTGLGNSHGSPVAGPNW